MSTPTKSPFARIIENAFHTGGEMTVVLKGLEEPFRGQVQDYDGEIFTLFHSGCCQGMLWTFCLSDVMACGLVVPVPQNLSSCDNASASQGHQDLGDDEDGDTVNIENM